MGMMMVMAMVMMVMVGTTVTLMVVGDGDVDDVGDGVGNLGYFDGGDDDAVNVGGYVDDI